MMEVFDGNLECVFLLFLNWGQHWGAVCFWRFGVEVQEEVRRDPKRRYEELDGRVGLSLRLFETRAITYHKQATSHARPC